MMRFGPGDGPVAVVAPPLFEEANRTRAVIGDLLRGLADRGIAGALPDLPGQGDSRAPTERTELADLRRAYAAAVGVFAAAGRRVHGVSVRSGVLLGASGALRRCWRFAPQDGPALVRELGRIARADTGASLAPGERWWDRPGRAPGDPVPVAGYLIPPGLLLDLSLGKPFDDARIPHRTVRLATDPGPADLHLPGSPPWRRAEPDRDPALSQALADDLADWIAACERR